VLKSLRQKAADRNEDEFYFGMMSRKGPGSSLLRGKAFDGKVAGDRGNKAMDVDTVRLLKTQDLGYLRTMRNVAAKEVRELEERFILAGGGDLVDDEDSDEDEDDFDDFDGFDDDDDINTKTGSKRKSSGGGSSRPAKKIVFCDDVEERKQALRRSEDQDVEMDKDDEGRTREAERKAQNLEKLQTKLRNAKKKLKSLIDAEHELEIQQAKMAKTATSGGITKTGRRIKVKERKR